jgi:MFS family permease
MLKKKRWQLVFLLFLAGMVNYLDRSALSVAAPLVSRDLGLGPADLGIIFSSFFFGYAIFNFIGGWASDKLGGKRVFTLAMAVWSAFCALTAAATGFVSLLVIRVFFGVGEGPLSSTINKVVNNWFPHREAASAVGFANCGTPLGGAIAGPIVGLLAVTFGWRASFVAIGVLGFVWLLFWMKFASETPREHPSITAEELQEIEGDHADPTAGLAAQPLGFYLRQPVVLATGLARISHRIRCIEAKILKESCWDHGFSRIHRTPQCRQSVSPHCLNFHRLKAARWWRALTVARSPRTPVPCCSARPTGRFG